MQRRMFAAVFAATLLLPSSGAAQGPDEEVVLIRGMRLSPFIGVLSSFSRLEKWNFEEGTSSLSAVSQVDIASGTAFGVQLEGPLRRRFGWQAAAAYAVRGETEFAVLQYSDPALAFCSGGCLVDGNHVMFLRAGPALHLHEQESELVVQTLNASLFAGGVVMYERPRNRLDTASFLSSGTHLGINLGANAEIPFGAERFAVQLGIEDNLIWWDKSQLRSLALEVFGNPGSSKERTRVSADPEHTWLMRAGLQFRF
jgi:hypothetical protein